MPDAPAPPFEASSSTYGLTSKVNETKITLNGEPLNPEPANAYLRNRAGVNIRRIPDQMRPLIYLATTLNLAICTGGVKREPPAHSAVSPIAAIFFSAS